MKYELLKFNSPHKEKPSIPTKQAYSLLQNSAKEALQKKINAIYNSEFEEEFEEILILPQEEFLNKVFSFSIKKIKDIFLPSELCYNSMKEMIEIEENQIRVIYLIKYKLLSTAFNDYEANKSMIIKYSKHLSSKNNDRFSFLKHFRKHCPLTDPIARHSCHRSNSKFLEVTEENPTSREELSTHVICINCKKCYPIGCMELYCTNCGCDYYSSLLSPNDKVDLLPATWKKYHCGSKVNEMMKCIQCRDILYLNCKSLLLMCLNKKCNFVSQQHSIIWKCVICKKDFNSDAKIYNPMEFNVMKKSIRNALIIKQKAFPNNIKCCKKVLPCNLTFYHKKECPGMLFKGVYNKSDIVVCSKCKAMNYFNKFVWTCPLCDKRFKDQVCSIQGDDDDNPRNIRKTNSDYTNKSQINKVSNTVSNEKDDGAYDDINRKSFWKNKRSCQYNTLMDILDERKHGLRNSAKDKNHKSTKSGDFRCLGIYSSDIQEELKNIPKKVCNNIFETFNIVNTENDNPLFIELACLKQLYDSKAVKKEDKPITDRRTSSIIDIDAKNDKKIAILKEMASAKEVTPSNEITPAKENNKIKQVSNTKMTAKANEKSLDAIIASSTIPLFDMDTVSISKSIGEGSFGKIYLIECPERKCKFALKKIIAHNIDEAKAVQKEIELMYSAHHDNIMKIFNIQYKLLDFSTYSIYVLMELAESDWNVEIKSRASRYRYYKEAELIHIIKQLTQALAFLQRKSISHRDIKPQNVLLYKHSVVKVADFGEAKEIKKAKQECTLKGTELYMSPILYEGLKKRQDDVIHNPYKSDVFSLGYCLLYASTLNPNTINELREVTNMKRFKDIIEKHLKTRYSTKFQSILYQMIEVDEKKRIDFIELENQLKTNYP